MWPKVLAQLFELLPHIGRLIPLADKFFASKTAAEKANEAALVAMAEGVRGDLGQITQAHSGLYRQLQDQSAQIASVAEDVKRARLTVEDHARRVEQLERTVTSINRWIKAGMGLIVVLLIVVIWLMLVRR